MTAEMRVELTPREYIRQLFAETREGKLAITYHYPDDLEEPYTRIYSMDWTAENCESMVQHYDALATMLRKFGQLHTELKNEEKRNCLLTAEEVTCWETYIRPFSPFEVEETVIGELYLRGEYDSLDDEENELLERHFWWRERNSLERMPFLRRSPRVLILRAQRYEKLVSLHAPEVVIQEEGRWLAEEMVLYYHGPQEIQVFEE